MASASKHETLFFYLRVLLACLLLSGLLAGIYFVAYRAYPTVATWTVSGTREAIRMDGETYRRVGIIGEGGLKSGDYPVDKVMGQVERGTGETASPTPAETTTPDGTPTLGRDHAYVLYCVKNMENAVLLLESDGSHALYWREIAAFQGSDRTTLTYGKNTYFLIGPIGENGLPEKSFRTESTIGLVRNDLADEDTAEMDEETKKQAAHHYLVSTVKRSSHLLLVEGVDGKSYLYCREGYADPPETEVPIAD